MLSRGHVDPERGQVLPLMAMLFIVFMGFAALAADAGYLRYEHQIQQTATDSAAIAGASELQYSSTSSNVSTAALTAATNNGYTANSNLQISVDYPPVDGPYASNSSAVEVVMQSTIPTFFEAILGQSSVSTKTRAVAFLKPYTGASIFVLSPSGAADLYGVTIDASKASLADNGALNASGSIIDLSGIGVAGTVSSSGTLYTGASPASMAPVSDPCPDFSGCLYLEDNPPSTSTCNYTNLSESGTIVTLSPGVYCGSTGFYGAIITLDAGTYVFTGPVLDSGSIISGTGITWVQDSGSLSIDGGILDLSAPATGNTEGMLFYQPSSNSSSVSLSGTSSDSIAGSMYFPSANVTTDGSSTKWLLLVTASLTMSGASLNVPATGAAFPGAIPSAVLVE